MDKTENKMKVYFDGDSNWYASPWNLEKTKKQVCKEFELSEEEIELEECNIDTEGMWIETNNAEDIKRLGDSDEVVGIEIVNGMHKRKVGFGDLERNSDYGSGVAKYISFRDVIKMDGRSEKPYIIATTNL